MQNALLVAGKEEDEAIVPKVNSQHRKVGRSALPSVHAPMCHPYSVLCVCHLHAIQGRHPCALPAQCVGAPIMYIHRLVAVPLSLSAMCVLQARATPSMLYRFTNGALGYKPPKTVSTRFPLHPISQHDPAVVVAPSVPGSAI